MSARQWFASILLLALAMPVLGKPPGLLEVEPDSLRPRLAAEYRSLTDKDASLTRIDLKPAFHLGHSSPHPRIPPGPFEAVWTDVLNLNESGPITFDVFVCGEATMEVDGVVVFQGRGESETAQVRSKDNLNWP